ncbi:MAG: substrate-binding domain-containing protein [Xenococcaceae cyanobacterium MO_234.B1]|nr:substrate-binding domain-containing protein [Xenococcaceae cyanobacterium MO_234.B1]
MTHRGTSLKNVMEQVKLLYQQQSPQTNIIYNFAASGTLQRQIEQGAEIDIFIAASPANMDK